MQFVETAIGSLIDSKFINLMGGFVPMEMVVKGKLSVKILICSSSNHVWRQNLILVIFCWITTLWIFLCLLYKTTIETSRNI